jgi:hypothetical protein
VTDFPIRFAPGMRCTHWKDGRTGTVVASGRALHGRYAITLEDADGTRFQAYTPHLIHERTDDRPTVEDLEQGYAELHAELTAHATTCEGCADQLKSGRPASCYLGKLLRTDLIDLWASYTVLRDGTPEPPAPAPPVQETLWPIPPQPQNPDLPQRYADRPIADVHLPA